MSNEYIKFMEKENKKYIEKIVESRDYLEEVLGKKLIAKSPKLAISLGFGLESLLDDKDMKNKVKISFTDIPNFLESGLNGNPGELTFATYKKNPVLILSNQAHFFEYKGMHASNPDLIMKELTLPIRVLKGLGIDSILFSNVSGGLNKTMNTPALMLCKSFVDKVNATPLSGVNDYLLGPRFPSMGGDECNEKLADYIRKASKDLKINLKEGNYVMISGPRYEFSGECRALGREAEAVGMTTVPEIITALHGYETNKEYEEARKNCDVPSGVDYKMARRLKVAAISCITNSLKPNYDNKTTEQEIISNSKKASEKFVPLIKKVISLYYS